MNVRELMNTSVTTCSPTDSLARAAQIMWERDCGVVPVVDAEGRVLAMITDRDICMAAFWQEKLLAHMPVTTAASRMLFNVHPDVPLEVAEEIMKKRRVRRLPVTDEAGHLLGLLSLSDIARHTGRSARDVPGDEVAGTLSAIIQRNVA